MMNLFVHLCTVLGILTSTSSKSTCNSHVTCGECIGHATETCVWISKEPFTERRERCQHEDYLLLNSKSINESHVHRPTSGIVDYVKNVSFSSTVQFYPQEIYIKASPGKTVNFTMQYKPAKDFGVDVYFLMDYSNTMKDHKEALTNQSLKIYEGLQNITRNVYLGVGSFIDKPALPYADPVGIHKGISYVYKNLLNLTDDMNHFKKVINDSDFGGNYDDAEAGLEALMQAMKCKSIGWRNNTRRIIVLATDSTYHSAGDGKMAGAFIPNNMQCNLEGGEYINNIAITHDYPSVSQIDKVASDGKFKIIFAALKEVKDVYEDLANKITGATFAELKKESNILKIITEEYQKSVDYIKLAVKDTNSAVELRYLDIKLQQSCPDPKKPGTIIENCKYSPEYPVVDIPASIKSLKCGAPGTKHTVYISPLTLEEELKIVFEVDCQCSCERSIDRSACDNHGEKRCGICICDEMRGGETCEFDCTEVSNNASNNNCYLNPLDKDVCNGRGKCKCGLCKDCDPDFSGDYCQYDAKSCKNSCSGNGLCISEACNCYMGWEDDDCSCSTDKKICTAPFASKPCSGRGNCKCGLCKCDKVPGSTNETYKGKFCDMCEECAKERCEELKEYARCNYAFKSKKVCDADVEKSNGTTVEEVNHLNKTEFDLILSAPCKILMEDGDFLLFKFDPENLVLDIQNVLEPAPKANIWVVCGSAIGTIVLIGILTAIIWKILISMYDKREYEKFCNEAKAQGYDVSQNPLYEPPTQSFVNPGFSQSNVEN